MCLKKKFLFTVEKCADRDAVSVATKESPSSPNRSIIGVIIKTVQAAIVREDTKVFSRLLWLYNIHHGT